MDEGAGAGRPNKKGDVKKNENCVTCLVEMFYPGCSGLVAHALRKDVCGACFHAVADHSEERLSELRASYARESRLDFDFEPDSASLRGLADSLSELELGEPEDAASELGEEARCDACPVCAGPTYSFSALGVALPCQECPCPPLPPGRRKRRVVRPVSLKVAGDSRMTRDGPLAKSEGRIAKLPPGGRSRKETVAKEEEVRVPEKPLVKQTKGFVCEWGSVNVASDAKCHIVDDDRYAPFYAHYFAHGKRKHQIFTGVVPDGEDPVMLVLEQVQEGGDPEDAKMPVRGLLFSCKPLSKDSDDRWVFLDPTVPMYKDLPEKKPALANVKWKEVVDEDFSDKLLNYEQKILSNTDRFKFGLLYVKDDQTKDENAMFQNAQGSEDFTHFMKCLGDVVDLKGWDKYAGGLNCKDGTTGDQSLYTTIRGYQIMFHVSTFLPHRIGDDQCLDKKRHLGNDVVVIVFCDSEDVVFDPLEIHSQFNHVFVVVVPAGISPSSGKRMYRMAVIRKPGVPPIEPKLRYPGVYEEGDIFREVFLTKLINGERMSMYAPDFVRKMYRTRKELMNLLLKDVKLKKTSVFKQVLANANSKLYSGRTSEDASKRVSADMQHPSRNRSLVEKLLHKRGSEANLTAIGSNNSERTSSANSSGASTPDQRHSAHK